MLALALSLFSYGATPKKPVPAAKKGASTKKASTNKAPVRKGTTTAKGRVRSKTAVTRSRTSSPPRQQTPTSERYSEIQRALLEKGYFKGEPTGVWGADSVDALKRFQAENNLTPDGKIGARSLIGLGLGPKHESTGEIAVTPKPIEEGK